MISTALPISTGVPVMQDMPGRRIGGNPDGAYGECVMISVS
jgi:hypothetical protein